MRKLEDWAAKAKAASELDEFISCLETEQGSVRDGFSLVIRDRSDVVTRMYNAAYQDYEELFLDSKTRDCIVDALSKRLEEIKRELKEEL